jgi:anti-sigma factor RsiW
MMRTDKEQMEWSDRVSGRLLWQRCRMIDAPEDEAARFLDLAAFAEGSLDEEEQDRIAALLAADPDAAADVAAARSLGSADQGSAGLERLIAQTCAIVPDEAPERGRVLPLARQGRRRVVQVFVQWGSLAAALVVASWLGFAMGTDTSLALSEPRQPSDASLLPDLFDPATGFLRDLGEGLRT